MFRRVRRVVVVGVVLVLCFIGSGAWMNVTAQKQLEEQRTALASTFTTFAPELETDLEQVARNPLLAPHEGGDASKLLSQHMRLVRWEGGEQKLEGPAPVPASLEISLTSLWTDQWAQHSESPELNQLDLGWLKELSSYGYWECEPAPEPSAPRPNFSDLELVAKARLLAGIRDGDVLAAVAELRELERLALTTECSSGVQLVTDLHEIEREALRDAGKDVPGWTPPTWQEDARFSRALKASLVLRSLIASGAAATLELGPFQCVALAHGLEEAHLMGLYLEPSLPERYAELKAELARSPCRLAKARRRAQSPTDEGRLLVSTRALCPSGPWVADPPCTAPDVSLTWLPLVRLPLGVRMLAQEHDAESAFWHYRHPEQRPARPDARK